MCPSLYLTGGTALSRFYFSHRYSDDLDLFTNEEAFFPDIVEKAVSGILKIDGIKLKNTENSIGTGYLRLDVTEGDTCLTVDFVNDIAFRLGIPEEREGVRVDTLPNIFTNKISALIGRDELKDIVDVREICRNCRFDWSKVIEVSAEKEASVDSEYIDFKLASLVEFLGNHPDFLNTINWIRKPEPGSFISDLEEIRKDVLSLDKNTLCPDSATPLEDLTQN